MAHDTVSGATRREYRRLLVTFARARWGTKFSFRGVKFCSMTLLSPGRPGAIAQMRGSAPIDRGLALNMKTAAPEASISARTRRGR